MTIRVDLRVEAAAEAVRIRALKAQPAALTRSAPPRGIRAAVLWRTRCLHGAAAVFITRTRVVDGSGRLVENFILPIEVRGELSLSRSSPGHLRLRTQDVFDRYQGAARAACLAAVAARVTSLAADYGRGLARARMRESRLAELAHARHALVQPGLFGRQASKDVVPAPGVTRESRDQASSVLIAQHSEIVLLLILPSRS
jgi:hypothetical protein